MVLNRVLLLAACITLMLCAMVFTISCSGDDGKAGAAGASCEVRENTDGNYDIYCGDVRQGTLTGGGPAGPAGPQGPKGEDGLGAVDGNCVVGAAAPGGGYNILCGDINVGVIGRPGSTNDGCVVTKADDYNDFELKLVCSGIEINTCNGVYFKKALNADQQVCHNGKSHTGDVNTSNYSGSGGDIITHNFQCNEASYDPNIYFCTTGTPEYLEPLCAGGTFTATTHFCTPSPMQNGLFAIRPLCGNGAAVAPSLVQYSNNQFCSPKTGDFTGETFDGTGSTYAAGTSVILPYCGTNATTLRGVTYNANYATATSSITSTNSWNVANGVFSQPSNVKFCINSTVLSSLCYHGGTAINGGGTIANSYNSTQLASAGAYDTTAATGKNKWVYYDPTAEFCRTIKPAPATGSFLVEKKPLCGPITAARRTYDDEAYFCESNVVVKKCGTQSYDEVTHFCYTLDMGIPYQVGVKCADDGVNYNPNTAFCSYSADGRQLPINKCAVPIGTTLSPTFNVAKWNDEYCNEAGTLQCGVNQVPAAGSAAVSDNPTGALWTGTARTCKCASGFLENSSTRTCTETSASCIYPKITGTAANTLTSTTDADVGRCYVSCAAANLLEDLTDVVNVDDKVATKCIAKHATTAGACSVTDSEVVDGACTCPDTGKIYLNQGGTACVTSCSSRSGTASRCTSD